MIIWRKNCPHEVRKSILSKLTSVIFFSYFSMKICCGTHWKHLSETLPMRTTTSILLPMRKLKYLNTLLSMLLLKLSQHKALYSHTVQASFFSNLSVCLLYWTYIPAWMVEEFYASLDVQSAQCGPTSEHCTSRGQNWRHQHTT